MQDATTFGGFVSQEHIEVSALYGRHHHQSSLLGKKVRQFVSSIDSNLLKIVFIPSDFITLGLLLQTRKKFAIIIQVIGKVNCLLGQSADDKPQYIFSHPDPTLLVYLYYYYTLLNIFTYLGNNPEASRRDTIENAQNSLRTQNLRPLKKLPWLPSIEGPRGRRHNCISMQRIINAGCAA